MVGKTVHHYQFLEKLGAGGMGEIWKAQDTRLNRIVAVKILTEASAGDPERRRRFIQEAQAASALNHPNIITIHDIISEGNAEYMVMEYVQGKTLIDLIPKGGLRVPQVLKYAVQMTDALQVAHAAGIIHRDLKPGNVMVTESGLVKVLDFGLAKLTDNSPLSQTGASAQTDATQTINHAPLTVEGSIIGTVSYMSPEQAQGKKVDSRSDIFSFAVVLYEMVTGSRAFAGDSALSTLSAILRDEVRPIPEIAPDTPPQLDQVIHRCLRKNPDQRFQTMKEVQIALGALKHESDSGMLYRTRVGIDAGPIPKGSRMPLIIAASVAAAVVAIGGGGARWWWTHRANPEAVVQTPVAAPPAAAVQPSPVVTPVAAPVAPAAPADQALTNDNIIQMVEAKVAPAVILSQIRNSKTAFSLSAPEVIRLTKASVPETVIEAMRNPKAAPSRPAAPVASSAPAATTPASTTTASATPASVPAPAPASSAASSSIVAVTLTDGMPFSITLAEDIPQNSEEGTQVHFTVARDVRVGDLVVIAKGAAVTGVIGQAARKGAFGIGGGKMTMRLQMADAIDGRKVRVRAQSARSSDGKNERPVETNVKPKNKELVAAAGTEYIAYVDGDVTVSVKK
ncbi:MAG: serine/threonine protein kinase [Acidobacteriia bacterium]|nr:serine/threonine protein kinase [Terriglobia bacterium]